MSAERRRQERNQAGDFAIRARRRFRLRNVTLRDFQKERQPRAMLVGCSIFMLEQRPPIRPQAA